MDHQPTTDDHTPRLIRQPFLLIRLIIFLILGFLNFLILIFSAWNVAAARTSGYDGPVGTSFVLFNSCMFLLLEPLALADMVFPHATTSLLKFELGWTGAWFVLSFAASIVITRDGPYLMCQPQVQRDVCVSSILLLPVSWFASILVFSYFIILMVSTAVHMQVYPNVHNVPIVLVPWFKTCHTLHPSLQIRLFGPESADVEHKVDVEKEPHNQTSNNGSVPRAPSTHLKMGDKKASWAGKNRPSVFSVASFTPQWAKSVNGKTKRGINNPFGPAPPLPTNRYVHAEDESMKENPERLSYWLGNDAQREFTTPPQNARPNYRVGEGLFELHRGKTRLPPPRPMSPISDAGTSTFREDQRMMSEEETARRSVGSVFPRDVREEEWNQPLRKPPFRNGFGAGWRTADSSIGARGRI